MAALATGRVVVAARIEVDFRRMVRIGGVYTVELATEPAARKVAVTAQMLDADRQLVAEATGVFVDIGTDGIGRAGPKLRANASAVAAAAASCPGTELELSGAVDALPTPTRPMSALTIHSTLGAPDRSASWDAGVPFETFLASAEDLVQLWTSTYVRATRARCVRRSRDGASGRVETARARGRTGASTPRPCCPTCRASPRPSRRSTSACSTATRTST